MKLMKPLFWPVCNVVIAAMVSMAAPLQAQQATTAGRQGPQATTRPQPADPNICLDEGGLRNSIGLMRKVNGQIQSCVSGSRWVAAPEGKVGTPAAEVGRKDCKGNHDQLYESGLLRQVSQKPDKFERCSDGRWIAWTGGH